MLAYVHYAKRPGIAGYTLVCGLFCLGLMAKPMLVTLPFVLLLLDYWPLARIRGRSAKDQQPQAGLHRYRQYDIRTLVAEKLPLLAVAAVSCIITIAAQKQGRAMAPLDALPLGLRVVNALHSYLAYIVKMAYPVRLAALYPPSAAVHIDSALLFVAAAAVILYLWGQKYRWLTVGILCYAGTLVPVIGLVQVGAAVMADRYTYLPSIGVAIVVVWAAETMFARLRYGKAVATAAGIALLVACILLTRAQAACWRNSRTLFKHALDVTENNFIMHNNYGGLLSREGKYDEALRQFKEAAQINPEYLTAKRNICTTLLQQKKLDRTIACFTRALLERQDWPDMYEMYNDLGFAYELKGDYKQAEMNYRHALILKPDYPIARGNLISVLKKQAGQKQSK